MHASPAATAARPTFADPMEGAPLTSSSIRLHKIRLGVLAMGKLSDGLVRLGPWGIGFDGLLSWIPGVGEVFGTVAAAYLLIQGLRARVPFETLLGAALLMGARTAFTIIPLIGPIVADMLPLHRWCAEMIARAIDARLSALALSGAA